MVPIQSFKKSRGELGYSTLPSWQEAFLSGILLALYKQCPAMYAYFREAEVKDDGTCWIIFFKLPPDVIREIGQVINVEKKKAFEFQQHSVLFTAISLQPSEEEMQNLERYYPDKAKEDQKASEVKGPDDESENSAADRLATSSPA